MGEECSVFDLSATPPLFFDKSNTGGFPLYRESPLQVPYTHNVCCPLMLVTGYFSTGNSEVRHPLPSPNSETLNRKTNSIQNLYFSPKIYYKFINEII